MRIRARARERVCLIQSVRGRRLGECLIKSACESACGRVCVRNAREREWESAFSERYASGRALKNACGTQRARVLFLRDMRLRVTGRVCVGVRVLKRACESVVLKSA